MRLKHVRACLAWLGIFLKGPGTGSSSLPDLQLLEFCRASTFPPFLCQDTGDMNFVGWYKSLAGSSAVLSAAWRFVGQTAGMAGGRLPCLHFSLLDRVMPAISMDNDSPKKSHDTGSEGRRVIPDRSEYVEENRSSDVLRRMNENRKHVAASPCKVQSTLGRRSRTKSGVAGSPQSVTRSRSRLEFCALALTPRLCSKYKCL